MRFLPNIIISSSKASVSVLALKRGKRLIRKHSIKTPTDQVSIAVSERSCRVSEYHQRMHLRRTTPSLTSRLVLTF